ncbi:hypothetical protein [Kitasatospora sp. NPDC089509]|uniref:hypothetical protein n=1 Tax=Kitasatospora sp. NPDC089509 TaxID=3364079 RepID=UPI0038254CB2
MSAALHTMRLTPVGAPAAMLFEARVVSAAWVGHGLLATDPAATAPVSTASVSTAPGGRPGPGFVDEHLVLDLSRPGGLRWRRQADVLHLGLLPAAEAHGRLAELLSAHPGCAVATAQHRTGTVQLLARTGARLVLRASQPPGSSSLPLVLGSLAHAWLAAGRALTELAWVSAWVLDNRSAHASGAPGRGVAASA